MSLIPKLGTYIKVIQIACPDCKHPHTIPLDMRDGDITWNLCFLKCDGCGRNIIKDEIEKQIKTQIEANNVTQTVVDEYAELFAQLEKMDQSTKEAEDLMSQMDAVWYRMTQEDLDAWNSICRA